MEKMVENLVVSEIGLPQSTQSLATNLHEFSRIM